MKILSNIILIFFIINCFLLLLIILLQSNRSAGMSLFGGGASQTAFGASSGDILTKITGGMVVIFLLMGLILSYLKAHEGSDLEGVKKELINPEQPIDTETVGSTDQDKSKKIKKEGAEASQKEIPTMPGSKTPFEEKKIPTKRNIPKSN